MHRVELKVLSWAKSQQSKTAFLMHRVELKVSGVELPEVDWSIAVPNAPCGVESAINSPSRPASVAVPNAPCGVESS